jgi:hypothetical protein
MGRGYNEIVEAFSGQSLTQGGVTRFSKEFPLGEGWTRMLLRFNLTVVIGTGAGVVAEAIQKFVKAVTLKTDRGELLCNSVPGRALYRWDQLKSGTPALSESVAAGSATYRLILPIWFADPLAKVPFDTVLDTARYSSINLELQVGDINDLYSAPGTATVTSTVDCFIERGRGAVPKKVRPAFYVEYGARVPVDPNSVSEILLERAANLAYKRLMIGTASSPTAGTPFSGTNSDAVLSTVTLEHDGGFPYNRVIWSLLTNQNKQDYSLETALVGTALFDHVRQDGSLNSAMYSGDKSRLSLKWANGGSMPNPAQVSLAYEAVRPLV